MAIVDPPLGQKFMLVPAQNVFTGAQPGSALVLHKTASGTSAEQIANFFINDPAHASSHFVIGQDGGIVQCVHLVDGAGANCCVESGYNPYWSPLIRQFGNLNRCTISIEHCDPASDNSTPLTSAQKTSSFRLIKWLVDQYGFDITSDGHGQMVDIKGHNSIDPINRARCPGNYPWSDLYAYLQGGISMAIPAGWHVSADGKTLYSPNNKAGGPDVPIVDPIKAYILGNPWPAANYALGAQYHTTELELSNPALGSGVQQLFRYAMLSVPDTGSNAGKVLWEWVGQELNYLRMAYTNSQTQIGALEQQGRDLEDLLAKATQQVTALQAEVVQLQAEITAKVPGIEASLVANRLTALELLFKQVDQVAQQGETLAIQPIQ